MRTADAAMVAARQKESVITRELVQFCGRNVSTGAIEVANFWNDLYTVTLPVIDGVTLLQTNYDFVGTGSLISIDGLQYRAEQSITVSNLDVKVSQIHPDVLTLLRGYDLHEQQFQYWQIDFDTETNKPVSPGECFFLGVIDTVSEEDAPPEGEGGFTISVRSDATMLTRKNTLYRTHACEILRDPDDEFYGDTQNVGDWQISWGVKKPVNQHLSGGGSGGGDRGGRMVSK